MRNRVTYNHALAYIQSKIKERNLSISMNINMTLALLKTSVFFLSGKNWSLAAWAEILQTKDGTAPAWIPRSAQCEDGPGDWNYHIQVDFRYLKNSLNPNTYHLLQNHFQVKTYQNLMTSHIYFRNLWKPIFCNFHYLFIFVLFFCIPSRCNHCDLLTWLTL